MSAEYRCTGQKRLRDFIIYSLLSNYQRYVVWPIIGPVVGARFCHFILIKEGYIRHAQVLHRYNKTKNCRELENLLIWAPTTALGCACPISPWRLDTRTQRKNNRADRSDRLFQPAIHQNNVA